MSIKTKYRLIFTAQLLCICIAVLGAISLSFSWFSLEISLILLSAFILFLVLDKPRMAVKYEAKQNVFGMENNFEYKYMSGPERREFDKQRQMEMERIVPSTAILKATHKGPDNPEGEINKLIGLLPTKQKMEEIMARAQFDKSQNKKSTFCGHFVFYGAPGTGKTTIARILTSFLYQNKCIKQNKCIEIDGNTLKGARPGDGAKAVDIYVKNAFGGVLFIDEAYSMSTECIDTLIKLMEDFRDKFILILAGYTYPMNQLLEKNPGFRSRIKEYLNFPNYTETEAFEIFKKMATDEHLAVEEDCQAPLTERYKQELRQKDFGNARTIRNILDESITNHAINLKKGICPNTCQNTLIKEDISTKVNKLEI